MNKRYAPHTATVPASHGRAVELKAGQALKIINTHGSQVVDCWAWNAHDLEEYMCMEASRVWTQRLCPLVGDSFVTNRRQPILTIVEDSSPGVHDTFMAACDRTRYTLLGVTGYHRNCCDNMVEGLAALGVRTAHQPLASFNIFMNIQVQPDGNSLKTLPAVSRPGDAIVLRAEMDCYVALSACPQDIVKIQGDEANTPVDFRYEVLPSAGDDIKVRGPWVPADSSAT